MAQIWVKVLTLDDARNQIHMYRSVTWGFPKCFKTLFNQSELFMKKLSLALAALALCGAAHAGTASAPFTVTVNFTSACTLSGTPVVAFGAYTAFGATVTAPTQTLAVVCSRGTVISAIDYDTLSGNGLFTTPNLQYVLTAPAIPALTAGTPATLSSVGLPSTGSISIDGTLPAQAGNTNSGVDTPASDSRTLTITF